MWKGAVAGACGGLIAAAVMERLQALWTWIGQRLRPQRQAHAASDPSTVKAAERVSEALRNEPLAPDGKAPAGEAVHYSMGIVRGAIYGLVAVLVAPDSRGR